MRANDVLTLSLRQLKERRLRTVLTILAIAVGVVSIVALSSQVEGVILEITKTLEKLGPETIMLTIEGTTPFTDADVARLQSVAGVSTVTPMLIMNGQVAGIDNSVTIVGVSSSNLIDLLGEINLLEGTTYYNVPAPQALIGNNIAIDEAGLTRYQTAQPLLIRIGTSSIMMSVIGVLDEYGSRILIQPDTTVFIPLEYVKAFSRSSGYTVIMVKAETPAQVDQVVELIGYIFGGRANITSMKQITQLVRSISSQINLLLVGIAGVSFVAAGLGTFNIMMVSVLERVREIGILKSLGMKDKGVLTLYIAQGLLLALFGSAMGIVLGSLLAYAIPALLGNGVGAFQGGGPPAGNNVGFMRGGSLSYTPVISPFYLGIATFMSIAVTLLSSAYPSWKASRMNPVEALRYG